MNHCSVFKSAVDFQTFFKLKKNVQNSPYFCLSKLHINLLPQSFYNTL
ncbi:hypothetical protein HMPREF9096_00595 [Haemophilus sp. oral taxon 851 str. F0397]|nr:hypothetical protein HMPREF9096_00595 [Haemophilus sp. oral taxon 851 str. F0397]